MYEQEDINEIVVLKWTPVMDDSCTHVLFKDGQEWCSKFGTGPLN